LSCYLTSLVAHLWSEPQQTVTYIPAVTLLNLSMAFSFGLTFALLSNLSLFPIAYLSLCVCEIEVENA